MDEESKKELLAIVDQIADLDKKISEIGKQRRKIWNRTSVIRAQLIVDIATAKDERGKTIYSNEKLREAALTLKLEENEKYQELTGKGWELDTEESTLATEHNRLVGRKEILMM